jgi:hypothetical protein
MSAPGLAVDSMAWCGWRRDMADGVADPEDLRRLAEREGAPGAWCSHCERCVSMDGACEGVGRVGGCALRRFAHASQPIATEADECPKLDPLGEVEGLRAQVRDLREVVGRLVEHPPAGHPLRCTRAEGPNATCDCGEDARRADLARARELLGVG